MDVHDTPDEGHERLDRAVGQRVARLQREHLAEQLPRARGELARLRAAVDEPPGVSSEVWQVVLEALPVRFIGTRDQPTAGEWAAHLALTLYAVHQRGNQQPMHAVGPSMGTAAGHLVRRRREQSASVQRRYDAVLSAASFAARRQHLRTLVGLLSTDSIPLDYGQLAVDLFRLQQADAKNTVNRGWGRDFYFAFSTKSEASDTTNSTADASTDTTTTTS